MRAAVGSAVLVTAALAGTACSSDDTSVDPQTAAADSPQTDPTATAQPTDEATSERTDTGAVGGGGPVTLQDAERIAVEAVGEGRVTWSGPEDDRGAAWEIEVTRDDGTEVDVLIDAAGNVVQ